MSDPIILSISLDGVLYKVSFFVQGFESISFATQDLWVPVDWVKPITQSLIDQTEDMEGRLIDAFKVAKAKNLIEVEPSSSANPVKSVSCIICPLFLLKGGSSTKLVPYDRREWISDIKERSRNV